MFYRPEDGHGLPHNPFNAVIAPRPIAWISTRSAQGVFNLAPYSFFNGVAYTPPQVMFATTEDKADQSEGKDTVSNIRETGVFCINMVEAAMMEAMNQSSAPLDKEVDEFAHAGVPVATCETIDCPRIDGAPASLECELVEIVRLRGTANYMTIGEVKGVHLRDDCLVDGKFDITSFQALARLGYRDYTRVTDAFALARPGDG